MINIIKIKNKQEINNLKKLNLEEYGLIFGIALNEEQDIPVILDILKIDIKKFKDIIEKLVKREIISLDIQVNEKIIWELTFLKKTQNEKNMAYDQRFKKLQKLFNISDNKLKYLNLQNSQELYNQCFNLLNTDLNRPVKVEINELKDYQDYLENNAPAIILENLNLTYTKQEYEVFFQEVYLKNMPLSLINLLIEYTVKTSSYNNFSITFFNKVIRTWKKNKINTLEKAMEEIKKIKDYKNKGQQTYIEPEWEQEMETEKIDVKEIKNILKEKNIIND